MEEADWNLPKMPSRAASKAILEILPKRRDMRTRKDGAEARSQWASIQPPIESLRGARSYKLRHTSEENI